MTKEHWSSFWNQGHITSFGVGLPTNYQGLIKDQWESVFSLQPVNATILDVATGNGAVALLALNYSVSKNQHFTVYASDTATIAKNCPASLIDNNLRNHIVFHERTACEALPFAENYFHLLTSQFGIEYSDIDESVPEAFRVLKQGGQLTAICHHSESEIVQTSKQELSVYRYAFDELALFDRVHQYLLIKKNRDATHLESKTINDTINHFKLLHGKTPIAREIVSGIAQVLINRNFSSLEEKIKNLALVKSEFITARKRLQDITKAALSTSDTEYFISLLEKNRFLDISLIPIKDIFGYPIAWKFNARKN